MSPFIQHDVAKTGSVANSADDAYMFLNKELKKVLHNDEEVIFGPSDDFEHKQLLHDFLRSKQTPQN